MLLDAIFFIPTLFTYSVIVMLICILCFIVVYISHKIYISIYDNLPLGHDSRFRTTVQALDGKLYTRSEQFANQSSVRSFWLPYHRSQFSQSTAVRIVLSLEPCYLACVTLEVPLSSKNRLISFVCNCPNNEGICPATVNASRASRVNIIKYYDELTKIPRYSFLLRCNQRSMESHIGSTMQQMLDDVITGAVDERYSDIACQPPSQHRGKTAH